MNQVIKKGYSTKNKIPGGKVLVQGRGDNLEEIEKELKKVLKSVQSSRTETNWLTGDEYKERDKEEAERKAKRRRPRSAFSLRIG